jgi:hypothetical protein
MLEGAIAQACSTKDYLFDIFMTYNIGRLLGVYVKIYLEQPNPFKDAEEVLSAWVCAWLGECKYALAFLR